jgi:hypothetical protein
MQDQNYFGCNSLGTLHLVVIMTRVSSLAISGLGTGIFFSL